VARLGGQMGELLSRSLRISNQKLRASASWTPHFASAREGWRAALDSFPELHPPRVTVSV
jgi:hypothetical protein